MPDKASGNRYGSRDSDFFSEEISSIGMSIRPSGSASSGEFIHRQNRLIIFFFKLGQI